MEGNVAKWAPFSTLMTAFPVIGAELLAAVAAFIDVPMYKFAQFRLDAQGNLQMELGWGHGGHGAIEDLSVANDNERSIGWPRKVNAESSI